MAKITDPAVGEIFEQEVCAGCMNYRIDKSQNKVTCPILDAHVQFNQDNPVLDFLMPNNGYSDSIQKCLMYLKNKEQ